MGWRCSLKLDKGGSSGPQRMQLEVVTSGLDTGIETYRLISGISGP